MACELALQDKLPISVLPPSYIVRAIMDTEPMGRSGTLAKAMEPEKLVSAFAAAVSLFVGNGDRIEIDARSGGVSAPAVTVFPDETSGWTSRASLVFTSLHRRGTLRASNISFESNRTMSAAPSRESRVSTPEGPGQNWHPSIGPCHLDRFGGRDYGPMPGGVVGLLYKRGTVRDGLQFKPLFHCNKNAWHACC